MLKMITRNTLLAALLTALCLLSAATYSAEMPRTIAFQGKVTDPSGRLLNEPHTLKFVLYDSASGGNALWSETHTNLVIVKGLFAVSFGAKVPLSPPFDAPYWVSVEVDGTGEMEPRLPLTSAPYALHAAVADSLTPGALQPFAIPSRVIVMWSGSLANIPLGWVLCDGRNDTPDLRDRFILGAGQSYAIDETGGAVAHVHGAGSYVAANHTHTFSGTTGLNPLTKCQDEGGSCDHTSPETRHDHPFSGTTDGGGGGSISGTSADASALPPFYALAFIMKK